MTPTAGSLTQDVPVLVVDDDDLLCSALEELLRQKGYWPATASDGEEALQWLAKIEFQVVLLDGMMPGLSGFDVLPQILADYPDTVVIMVTGVDDVSKAVEAMKLGACDYVTKPFRFEDLVARLEKARQKRKQQVSEKSRQRGIQERLVQREKELREISVQLTQAMAHEAAFRSDRGAGARGRVHGSVLTRIKEMDGRLLRRVISEGGSGD